MTSPRSGLRITVSVKALIETYLAKNRSSTARQQDPAGAAERRVVDRQAHLQPAPGADGPAPGMRRTTGCG